MDHPYSNTKPHQKGKHLKLNDRTTIQELHSKGYSNRAIARELNCSPSTVGYELKRGTVSVYRYKAVEGQSTYELHRSECGRKSWSLDACVGYGFGQGNLPEGSGRINQNSV